MNSSLRSLILATSKALIALLLLCTAGTASAETIYLFITSCNPPQSRSQSVYVTVHPSAAVGLPAGDYAYYVGNSSGSIANSTTHTFHYDGTGGWTPASARWLQASAVNYSEPFVRTVDVWYPLRSGE